METEEFLEHYGVKGMRWGHRKTEEQATEVTIETAQNKVFNKKNAKRAAVVLGSAAIVAAGAYYVSKHPELRKSLMSNIKKSNTPKAETLVKKVIQEPTDVIHGTRAKDYGFGFVRRGGLKDPLKEYENAFPGGDATTGVFKRFGANNEKIGVSFLDPLGRKDRAGRVIPHEVILPKQHTEGITTYEQAKKVAWDLVKDDFDKLYDLPPGLK